MKGWKTYIKLAVPGFAMLFFEWSNFGKIVGFNLK
jgi:hypothetical protein